MYTHATCNRFVPLSVFPILLVPFYGHSNWSMPPLLISSELPPFPTPRLPVPVLSMFSSAGGQGGSSLCSLFLLPEIIRCLRNDHTCLLNFLMQYLRISVQVFPPVFFLPLSDVWSIVGKHYKNKNRNSWINRRREKNLSEGSPLTGKGEMWSCVYSLLPS